jgi:hypothetical protein
MSSKCLRAIETKITRTVLAFTILLFSAVAFAGCSATPTKPDTTPTKSDATPTKPDSTPTRPDPQEIVFQRPADDVQKAAANALVVKGFEIKKDEPLYVEGSRQRALGLLVGETVGVRLESLGPSRTRVKIETVKSAVSIGQKNWDAAVLEEMEMMLGKRK